MDTISTVRDAVALAAGGDAAGAVASLVPHLARRDADALLVAGLWQVEGRTMPRDLDAARTSFAQAAAQGHVGAARMLQGFVARGVGGVADWPGGCALLAEWAARDPVAARQHAAIEAMQLDASGDPADVPTRTMLSSVPYIASIPGLLTADECRLLIDLAQARFKPATIFHEARGAFVADPVRQSDGAGFPLIAEGPFVHAINRRIAAASDTDVLQGETLQVLRYGPGQQYRPHLDAIAGLGNQRVLTMLVWLNDAYDGGETWFAEGDLALRGKVGDALLFANVTADGRPDPATRHAGMPVTRGAKLIASRWIRERPVPPGMAFDAAV